MPKTTIESIALFFRDDRSDKVYHIYLNDAGDGFVTVDTLWGARLGHKTPGTKTKQIVSLEHGRKVYAKTIAEQLAKGYIEGEATESYTPPATTVSLAAPVACLLLTEIAEADVDRLLRDQDFAAMEKIDGDRTMLVVERSGVTGYNRKGKVCVIPNSVVKSAEILRDVVGSTFSFDGELIGSEFYAFDLLSLGDHSMLKETFETRLDQLRAIMGLRPEAIRSSIIDVPAVETTTGKRVLLTSLRERGAEGLVFKSLSSPYRGGRQSNAFKLKFCAESSVVVTGFNEKASVAVSVYDQDKLVPVGNVTIRDSSWKLAEGDIIDVRYLYAYRGGSLFQPRMIRKRDDITPDACTIDQLKYKAEARA